MLQARAQQVVPGGKKDSRGVAQNSGGRTGVRGVELKGQCSSEEVRKERMLKWKLAGILVVDGVPNRCGAVASPRSCSRQWAAGRRAWRLGELGRV